MARCILLALAVLSATGCAPVPSAPPGVSVAVVQGRTDVDTGLMALRITNDSAAPVRVTSVSYDDPRLAVQPVWAGDSEVPAGAARDLRVPMPDAACDGDAEATGTATVEFLTADGAVTAEYPVDDSLDLLPARTESVCFAQRVAEVATFEWERIETGGDTAVLQLTVTSTGEDGIQVEAVSGTVLLVPDSAHAGWPLDLTVARDATESVEISAAPGRCDAHALAEDKLGTRFRISVRLLGDDGTAGTIVVPASDAQRAALHAFVARACGANPPPAP